MADELIPLNDESDGKFPVHLDPSRASKVDGHWSSINEQDDKGKFAVINAMVGEALRGRDLLKESILVSNLLVHVVQLTDPETGEVVEGPRVVLIDPDGVCVSFVSMGVLASLKKIITVVGPPPWTPPLICVPIAQRTRKGFDTIILTCKGRQQQEAP